MEGLASEADPWAFREKALELFEFSMKSCRVRGPVGSYVAQLETEVGLKAISQGGAYVFQNYLPGTFSAPNSLKITGIGAVIYSKCVPCLTPGRQLTQSFLCEKHAVCGKEHIFKFVFYRNGAKLMKLLIHERLAVERPMQRVRGDPSFPKSIEYQFRFLRIKKYARDVLMMFRIGLRAKFAPEIAGVCYFHINIFGKV